MKKQIRLTAQICAVFAAILLINCGDRRFLNENRSTDRGALPITARILKDAGNGWVLFEWENKTFLFREYASAPYLGFSALTQVIDSSRLEIKQYERFTDALIAKGFTKEQVIMILIALNKAQD